MTDDKENISLQVVSKDLLRMSMNLEKIDAEIANKSLCLGKTQTLSKSVGLEAEIRELKRRRDEINDKVDTLNKKVTLGKYLVWISFSFLSSKITINDKF